MLHTQNGCKKQECDLCFNHSADAISVIMHVSLNQNDTFAFTILSELILSNYLGTNKIGNLVNNLEKPFSSLV